MRQRHSAADCARTLGAATTAGRPSLTDTARGIGICAAVVAMAGMWIGCVSNAPESLGDLQEAVTPVWLSTQCLSEGTGQSKAVLRLANDRTYDAAKYEVTVGLNPMISNNLVDYRTGDNKVSTGDDRTFDTIAELDAIPFTTKDFFTKMLSHAVASGWTVPCSVDVAGQLTDSVVPTVPTNVIATATSSSEIRLVWTPSADNVGITAYRLEQCTGAGCTAFTEIATVPGTGYANTSLTPDTVYRYRVRAADAARNISGYSAVASATTPSPAATIASCDQTLSPGADVVSAVSSAPSGATVCLNAGNYGVVNFSNIGRTGLVTLRSTLGASAAMSPQISGSDFIKFQHMTLNAMLIQNCSTNIQVVENTWATDTSGLVVNDHGFNCPATDKKILIDGNTFINTQPAWSEGKIGLVSARGVTLSNNKIQGQSVGNGGDGIQAGGELANIVVGPGNVFRDIRQAACDATPGVPHCDAIQIVGNCPTCTINGNWFDNVEVVLQHHDGVAPVVFTNNLVTNATQMWAYSTPGSASNSRIEHNTFYNLALAVWGTTGSGVSDTTGLIGRNNILVGATAQPSTCRAPSCSFTHNLCQTAKQCGFSAANVTIGTPTLVGGTPSTVTTWAGWKLATNSLGLKGGSDGQDLGITYYGSGVQ